MADHWVSYDPVDGLQWHETREIAEAYLLDVHEEELRDHGEGADDLGWVALIVSEADEVVGAHKEDDSEDGAWLRERGLDYMIDGYRMVVTNEAQALLCRPDPATVALLDLLRSHHEAGLLLDLLGIGATDDDPLADALEAWADAGYPGVSDE